MDDAESTLQARFQAMSKEDRELMKAYFRLREETQTAIDAPMLKKQYHIQRAMDLQLNLLFAIVEKLTGLQE